MSDAYVECMVAKKTSGIKTFFKYLVIALAAAAFLLGVLFSQILLMLIGIAAGVGAYFIALNCDIEYEYLYLDKEITVDKILNKTKRKRIKVYEVEKIEIMAPLKSYHLDEYKNRNYKITDISSNVEKQPDTRYVFFYNGEEKVIFEPSPEMVKMCRNVAPRKVFND